MNDMKMARLGRPNFVRERETYKSKFGFVERKIRLSFLQNQAEITQFILEEISKRIAVGNNSRTWARS